MKKVLLFIMSLTTAFCLTACGGGTTIGDMTLESGQSGFYIKADGTVEYAVLEAFDKDYYSEGDLEDAVETEIEEYNGSNMASVSNAIELEEVEVSDEVASVKLNFTTVYDFYRYVENYNMLDSEKFYVGTISSNPYKLNGNFVSPEGDQIKAKEINAMDAEIIVLDGVYQIQIEGKVLGVSDNCTIKENDTITTANKGTGTSYIVYMTE